MIFRLKGRCREFEIPDDWWSAAGMSSFAPGRSAYRAQPHPTLSTVMLRINEISASPRARGVPDFGKERMISVLEGIRLDQALPPIEVEVEQICEGFIHRLYNGRHRFCASIAVDFSHVPAQIVDMRGLLGSTGVPSA
jgi:hypothetical protein